MSGIKERSPLTHVDRISKPLLIGRGREIGAPHDATGDDGRPLSACDQLSRAGLRHRWRSGRPGLQRAAGGRRGGDRRARPDSGSGGVRRSFPARSPSTRACRRHRRRPGAGSAQPPYGVSRGWRRRIGRNCRGRGSRWAAPEWRNPRRPVHFLEQVLDIVADLGGPSPCLGVPRVLDPVASEEDAASQKLFTR